MALGNYVPVGGNQSKTAGTTLALNVLNSVGVGYLIVVVAAFDNEWAVNAADTTQFTGCTDSAGNTYTKVREYTQGSAGANNGVAVVIYLATTTNALPSGGTVTVSSSSRTARSVVAMSFTRDPSKGIGTSSLAGGGASNVPADLVFSTQPNREYLMVHAVGYENVGNATFNPSGGFTVFGEQGTTGGSAVTNVGIKGSYRVYTGTTLGTGASSLSVSSDYAQALLLLWEVALGPTIDVADSVTLSDLLTLDSGVGHSINPSDSVTTSDSLTANVTTPKPKLQTLTDAFDTLDSAKWPVTSGGVSVAASQANLPCTATPGSALGTNAEWDLTDSFLSARVTAPPSPGMARTTRIEVARDGSNRFLLYRTQSYIYSLTQQGGGTQSYGYELYDPVAHAWLRIRESGGTVYYEASANGVSWGPVTNAPSSTFSFPVTEVSARFSTEHTGTSPSAEDTVAYVDNVNIEPLLLVLEPADSVTVSDSLTTVVKPFGPEFDVPLDDFNRADGPVAAGVGADIWTDHRLGSATPSNELRVVGNQLATNVAGGNGITKVVCETDMDLVLDCIVSGTINGIWHAATDTDVSTYNGVSVGFYAPATQWWATTYVGGGGTSLGSYVGPTILAGETVYLRKRGTTLQLWKRSTAGGDWTKISEHPNAPARVGAIGFTFDDTASRWDNLRAGPLVEPSNVLGVNDSVALDDQLTLVVDLDLPLTDSVSTSDSLATASDYVLAAADSVTTSDALALAADQAIALADTVTPTDAAPTWVQDHVLDLADSVTTADLPDFVGSIPGLTLDVADDVTTSDSLVATQDYVDALADAVTTADAVAFVHDQIVAFADAVVLSDSVATATDIGLALADSVVTADAASFEVGLVLSLADTAPTSDVVDLKVSVTGSVSQSYVFGASTSGRRGTKGVVSQTYVFGAATAGKATVKGSVSQSYYIGIDTNGKLLLRGSVTTSIRLGMNAGELPEWFRPESSKSWKHLLRESKDPGGEVVVGTNRWLAGTPSGKSP